MRGKIKRLIRRSGHLRLLFLLWPLVLNHWPLLLPPGRVLDCGFQHSLQKVDLLPSTESRCRDVSTRACSNDQFFTLRND